MRQVWCIVAAFSIAIELAGCAGIGRQDDDQLVQAGFTKVKADTPEWAATMRSLPAHHFVHRTVNGVSTVLYADPVGCRCVYSGSPQSYAGYKQVHREDLAAYDASLSEGDSVGGH